MNSSEMMATFEDDNVEAPQSPIDGTELVAPEPVEEEHTPRHAEIEDHSDDPPRPGAPNRAPHKGLTQLAKEVYAGKWGGDDVWEQHLEESGYNVEAVRNLVDRGVGKRG